MHIHTPDISKFTTPNIHSIQIVKLQYKLLQNRLILTLNSLLIATALKEITQSLPKRTSITTDK